MKKNAQWTNLGYFNQVDDVLGDESIYDPNLLESHNFNLRSKNDT